MGLKIMNGRGLSDNKGKKKIQECEAAGRGQVLRRTLRTAGAIFGAFLLVGTMVTPLCAQSYPNKPIRLIIPSAPGGGSDIVGRVIGKKLAERLGQPVVVENRPGAGGNIGTEFVAKTKPDGYTIVLVSPSFTIGPSIYKQHYYDPVKDFAPISMVAAAHNLLLVRPSLPVKNLKELVDYAKANPGKLNFGTSGIGTPGHLAIELFKSLAKINIVHVPYKGLSPAVIGVIGGEVDMMVSNVSMAMPHIQAGKVRAFAVLSHERLPLLPDVPTAKEAGIDNWEVMMWWGILAPAGTPRDIVSRLNVEWARSAVLPDTIEMIKNAGLEPMSGKPEQLSEFVKVELDLWAKVIKEANIKSFD
jgi:tripartite-type tricarboxylate transporter receptor subunit TctC